MIILIITKMTKGEVGSLTEQEVILSNMAIMILYLFRKIKGGELVKKQNQKIVQFAIN